MILTPRLDVVHELPPVARGSMSYTSRRLLMPRLNVVHEPSPVARGSMSYSNRRGLTPRLDVVHEPPRLKVVYEPPQIDVEARRRTRAAADWRRGLTLYMSRRGRLRLDVIHELPPVAPSHRWSLAVRCRTRAAADWRRGSTSYTSRCRSLRAAAGRSHLDVAHELPQIHDAA
jgi:hypothetical protein